MVWLLRLKAHFDSWKKRFVVEAEVSQGEADLVGFELGVFSLFVLFIVDYGVKKFGPGKFAKIISLFILLIYFIMHE